MPNAAINSGALDAVFEARFLCYTLLVEPMHSVRSLLVRGMTAAPIAALFRPLLREQATIFMLHRFDHPDRGVRGHDPKILRSVLERLRRERYTFAPLDDVVRGLIGTSSLPGGAIAFTIDDGYADHAEVAAPVFAEFDCPVTTFVTTGFLDKRIWFWWDKLEFLIEHTKRRSISTAFGSGTIEGPTTSSHDRQLFISRVIAAAKALPEQEKLAAIEGLASAAEIELPEQAPARYAPMSWSDLRACEASGMNFGPHTVTHPILARTSDLQARQEIRDSWSRLREEAARPIPVFCYPNGQHGDFGNREIAVLRQEGLIGAVVGTSGYASVESARSSVEGPYLIRRFSYPDNVEDVVQCAAGLERFKQLLRREVA